MDPLEAGRAAITLGIAVLWAGSVAWLLLRATRQMRLYVVIEPDDPLARPAAPVADVAVIVPVRDEAPIIAHCVDGLLGQTYPSDRLRIIVVDDNSGDGTAGIVRGIAGAAPNLRLQPGRPLPAGWAGKPHACWQGALEADDVEWLCFIDADTRAEPALLRRAIAVATERRLDMLSLEPFQELGSFWDRLIIPVGLFAIACALDLRRASDPGTEEASVNGQFLLIRRDVYFAVGGHAAVRAEICEDSALARRVKQAGYRLGLFGADRLIRVRMYGDLASLWEGISKNATEIFGGPGPTLTVAAAGLLLGWATLLLPLWAAFSINPAASGSELLAFILLMAGSLAMVATQIAGARHFRIPWWYGLLFPLACTAAALLAFNGVLMRVRGRVSWKGRVYPVPRKALRPEP